MAFGSPRDAEDDAVMRRFYTHVRNGRAPSAAEVQRLAARYRAIGGSPLPAITQRQAEGIGARAGLRAYVGMKHAHPFIAESAAYALADGHPGLVGLVMAPQFARASLGAYEAALREGWEGAGGDPAQLVFIPGFHDDPGFIGAVASTVREALATWEADLVVFTAYTLPARVAADGDPYPEQLETSSRLVAEAAGLSRWRLAYQGGAGPDWLGPSLREVIEGSGAKRVLVCPIGFVSDHLEILYDLDLDAIPEAVRLGIELRRTASLNDRPEFLQAMAAIVRSAAARIQPPLGSTRATTS